MILKNKDGSTFSLSLEAVPLEMRPFPGRNKWDSWLQIIVSVRCLKGNWKVTDECLLLTEAEELVEWFKAIAMDQFAEKEISFIEPNLRFEILRNASSKVLIRLSLMAEIKPPWSSDSVFEMNLEVSKDELSLEAQRFKEEIFNYTRR